MGGSEASGVALHKTQPTALSSMQSIAAPFEGETPTDGLGHRTGSTQMGQVGLTTPASTSFIWLTAVRAIALFATLGDNPVSTVITPFVAIVNVASICPAASWGELPAQNVAMFPRLSRTAWKI